MDSCKEQRMKPRDGEEERTSRLAQCKDALSFIGQAAAETLWPARCSLCNMPGSSLCERCLVHLPYLDVLFACPRCGAPYGVHLCTECNSFTLEEKGLKRIPLDSCASALVFGPEALRIVITYKDRGERDLACSMGKMMARAANPAWIGESVAVGIPTRPTALKRRGFNASELLARTTAEALGIPYWDALRASDVRDQRALSARQRLQNMAGSMSLKETARADIARMRLSGLPSVVLIDDVMTTGATMYAGAAVLRHAGIPHVYGLTFARVV